MSTFYLLETNSWESQWHLGMIEEQYLKIGHFKDLKNREARDFFNEFWKIDNPLDLVLWCKDYENTKSKKEGFKDTHEWIGNIMHDPPLIGRPMSNMIITSIRFKEVLESLNMPNHRFHQFNVIKEDDQEKRIYFGLQLSNEVYSRLVYSEVTFTLKKRKEEIRTYSKGEIGSYSEYLIELGKMREKYRLSTLVPDKLVYKENFDLLLNVEARFVVSEVAKNKLANMGLTGVEFTKYDKQKIITGFV